MLSSPHLLLVLLMCSCTLSSCVRQGFDERRRATSVEDARAEGDQRSSLDGAASVDGGASVEAGTSDAAALDGGISDASTPDASQTDTVATDAATSDTAGPDSTTADLGVPDAKPFDTSVTLSYLSGACGPSERVVGGSAACSGASIRTTEPNGLDAWQQFCRGSTLEPASAICAGGELATVVQRQRTSTIERTNATCDVGMRVIGGGCACGIGDVSASHQENTGWTCGCTDYGGIEHTSTALCVADAIADAIGLVMVTGGASGNTATATCPDNKVIIGGGCEAAPGSIMVGYFVPLRQHRYEPPNSWFCEMGSGSTTLTAQAFCIDAL